MDADWPTYPSGQTSQRKLAARMQSRWRSWTRRTDLTGSLATKRNSPCSATIRGSAGESTRTESAANSWTAEVMAPICRWKLPDTVAFSINTSNAGAAGRLRLVSTGVNTSAEKEREYTPVSPGPLSSETLANILQPLAV